MSNFMLYSSDYGPLIINDLDTGVGWQIKSWGTHEAEVVNFGKALATNCRKLSGPGVCMLDVGANIGTCTVPWAKHMKHWGAVIAYEPQERIFYALGGNIVLNNLMNVHARHAAVCDYTGTMKIPQMNHNLVGNFGGLHLRERDYHPTDASQQISYKPEHMVEVATIQLDTEHLKRVDVIKIDVEGMELDVLKGAFGYIRTFSPVIIAEHIHCGEEAIKRFLGKEWEYIPLGGNTVCVPKAKLELLKDTGL